MGCGLAQVFRFRAGDSAVGDTDRSDPAAAGIAKLDPSWLSGRELQQWQALTVVGGPLYANAVGAIVTQGLSCSAAAIELGLVPLLSMQRTRVIGIALGLALHYAFAASMLISTFSVQMALYLMLFWPRWTRA